MYVLLTLIVNLRISLILLFLNIYTYSFGCPSSSSEMCNPPKYPFYFLNKYKSNPRKVKFDSQQTFLPLMNA